MGSTYKIMNSGDVISKSTLLHEAIPLTGSLVSGTYENAGSDENVKNYSHGMFQSVYDYPYLSSSANHLFDITAGYSNVSALSGATNSQNAKKINIYNQMAQVLVGYDHTGSILRFDEAGEVVDTGTKMDEVYFLNFSRLLVKDEIKKGTFELELGVANDHTHEGNTSMVNGHTTFNKRVKLVDHSGSNGYKVNSPAGEYGVLYAQTTFDGDSTLDTALLVGERIESNVSDNESWKRAGLLFYQAGVCVVSGSIFTSGGHATAVDCIDTTGYVNSNADASFRIDISSAAGGLGGTAVTVLLDENQNGGHSSAADTITVGTFDGSETDALAAGYIIDAINGVTNSRVVYATSGNGQSGADLGVTAALGSSDTQITLTMNKAGTSGNITSALASVSGHDVVDVTAFTNGVATTNTLLNFGEVDMSSTETGTETISDMLTGSTIEASADAFRNRIYNIQFNNTTELNSTIYFCRVNHNEFNYSTNPTYTSASQINVKVDAKDSAVSYITTIGLYNAQNELLAVAKTSEPLVKTPEDELTLRVRLDY
jgi:hypothetical protein